LKNVTVKELDTAVQLKHVTVKEVTVKELDTAVQWKRVTVKELDEAIQLKHVTVKEVTVKELDTAVQLKHVTVKELYEYESIRASLSKRWNLELSSTSQFASVCPRDGTWNYLVRVNSHQIFTQHEHA